MLTKKTVYVVFASSVAREFCAMFTNKLDAEIYKIKHHDRHGFVMEMGRSEAVNRVIRLWDEVQP